MKRLLTLAILATALGTASCRDATDPVQDQDAVLAEDLAYSSGAAIAGDIAEMAGGQATLIGPPLRLGGPPRAFDRQDCPYNAETGWHECAGTTPRGLALSLAYGFFTAAGESQERFDALATESIRSRARLAGTVTSTRFTATVDQARETTVSGLAGTESRHVFNGTGTRNEATQSLGTDARRASTLVSHDTVTNVVRLLPASENPWPASGSVVHAVTMTRSIEDGREVSRTVHRRVLITFNGTQFVPMVVGDREFTLDLAAGRPVGQATRRR